MNIHWCCTCGASGTYDAATAPKTDSALEDGKHQAKCQGSTSTSARGEWVTRAGEVAE